MRIRPARCGRSSRQCDSRFTNRGSTRTYRKDAAAFTAHPYGQPVVGWPSDLKAYSATDAAKFFKRYYIPANLVVAVVGDAHRLEGLQQRTVLSAVDDPLPLARSRPVDHVVIRRRVPGDDLLALSVDYVTANSPVGPVVEGRITRTP